METLEFNVSTHDGLKLKCRGWIPVQCSTCILLVHGLGEHGGRYRDWALRFAASGMAFFSYDQRGHGLSEGRKGHIPEYDSLLQDVESVQQSVQEILPDTPLVLYGHSMGGGIALNYLITRDHKFSRGIVTSPWLKLALAPSNMKLVLARILRAFLPGLRSSNGLEVKDMSHNEEVVAAYHDDPLVHNRISLRMFLACRRRGHWALEHAAKLNTPVLLMHGTGDRITSWQASKEFAERAGETLSLKLWDNQYHELHHEEQKDSVFDLIDQWLSNNNSHEIQD